MIIMVMYIHIIYIYIHIYINKYFRTSFSDNPFNLQTIFIIIRIESRTFLKIVKGFQTFALVMKSSA